MAIYVVMEPPAANAEEASMRAVIVRDGFSFIAFIAPLVWLLWHRLWIEAILVLAASVVLMVAGEMLDHVLVGAVLSLLLSIYVGLEASDRRLGALRRRGWREWGAVEAGSVAEAEIRYLAGEQEDLPVAAQAPNAGRPVPPASFGRPVAGGPALGLLGYPGRH